MALTKVIGAGIGTVTNQFADANMSSGSVLQIVHTQAQTAQGVTSTSYAEFNGYNTAITPSSTSSKILIHFGYHVFRSSWNTGAWRGAAVRLMRVTGDTVLITDGADYGIAANFNAHASDRFKARGS